MSAAPGTAEHTAQLSGHEQGQQAPTAAVHGHFADTELDATLDDTAAASPAALGSAAVEGPATALPDAVIGPSMPAAPSQDAPAANAASNAAVDGPEGQPEAGIRHLLLVDNGCGLMCLSIMMLHGKNSACCPARQGFVASASAWP